MEQNELVAAREWCVQAAVELLSMHTKVTPEVDDVIACAKAIEAYICEGKG